MQNRAAAGAGAPHCAQNRSSAVPQPMQKRASGGFAVSHLPHMTSPDIAYSEPEEPGRISPVLYMSIRTTPCGAPAYYRRHRGDISVRMSQALSLANCIGENVCVPSASVEVIRRLNAAFNANDVDTFQSLLDPAVEFVDHLPLPDVQASAVGVEELTSVLEHGRDGFTSFKAEVVEYVDLGEYVVCTTRWRFRSRDDALELDWVGAEAHQVRDGKLVWSAAGFRDSAAAIRAIEERSGIGTDPRS